MSLPSKARVASRYINAGVTFREGPSPIKDHPKTSNATRLALCDSSVVEAPHKSDMFFSEIEKWRYHTRGRRPRRLKNPVLEYVRPGAGDNCIIGFLDFHLMGEFEDGKKMWFLDYMKTRGEFRGQRVASRLMSEFFKRHVKSGDIVNFGRMMQKQIGHLREKMQRKYPDVEIIGHRYY